MNSTTRLNCKADNFEFVDPLPGVQKQCMCDNSKTVTTPDNIQIIKDSWRQRKLVNQLHDILVIAEKELEKENTAAATSKGEVDNIKDPNVPELAKDKAAADKTIIDTTNSTGRATCATAQQTSIDKATEAKKGLVAAQELADSTKATATASLALSIKEASDANSAKATTDEQAAIDAAIKLASLQERLSNADTAAELNYNLCLTRLNHTIQIK